MPEFRADVTVTLRPVINDPQGLVVLESLHQLGFSEVNQVRVGKHIEMGLTAVSRGEADAQVERMCAQLLRNSVIEDSHFVVHQQEPPS